MGAFLIRPGVTRFLLLTGAAGLAASQWLVFMYAPLEAEMKLIQKIFYIHLPLAWGGMLSFSLVFAASAAYLWSGNKKWNLLAGGGAAIGLLLAVLALVTGSIWARKAWGIWWTWEPRLTTTFIMCFVYAGYLMLGLLDLPERRRAAIQAVVGIVAFLDVPLVFFAARMQRAHHPSGIMASGGGLEPEMRVAVFACLFFTALLWAGLMALRYRLANTGEKTRDLRLRLREREWERKTR